MNSKNYLFKTIIVAIVVMLYSNPFYGQFVSLPEYPPVDYNARYVIGVSCNVSSTTTPTNNCASGLYQNSQYNTKASRLVKSAQATVTGFVDLGTAINQAVTNGYRNIYIQRGQYVITGPITITADNITIEGESNLTVIKPISPFAVANSVFQITGKNNVIKNLSIDSSAFSGIMAGIELQSGAENNSFQDISIMNISTSPGNITFQQGAIYLNNQTGYIHNNTFDNIFMLLVNKGIVFNSVFTTDGIRHNTFRNIKMDRARENNIQFVGTGFKPFRNTFEGFSIQPFASQTNVLKDVAGNRNVFNNFKIADWTTQGQVVNITNTAWATVITNFEMANSKVHSSTNDIDDQGKLTQLLFNERAGVMYSQLGFDGFNNGSNNKSLTAVKGGLMLSAEQGGVNNYFTPTAGVGKVLTCLDSEGRATWQTLGSLAWDHIASKNINMNSFALTNVSNTATTPPLEATDPSNPSNPANTLPGLRLDTSGNVRIGTTAPNANNFAKLQVDGRVFIGDASTANTTFLTEMSAVPADYKLIVNGKVRVRNEVYVKQDGLTWPDYVFANNYKLMPLQEVEQHINEKGYLPNMPSAAEVQKDGIAVGDLIKRQQEKIEELTLYLIEMKKEIEALKSNQKN